MWTQIDSYYGQTSLGLFLKKLNSINKTIFFTLSHTNAPCPRRSRCLYSLLDNCITRTMCTATIYAQRVLISTFKVNLCSRIRFHFYNSIIIQFYGYRRRNCSSFFRQLQMQVKPINRTFWGPRNCSALGKSLQTVMNRFYLVHHSLLSSRVLR